MGIMNILKKAAKVGSRDYKKSGKRWRQTKKGAKSMGMPHSTSAQRTARRTKEAAKNLKNYLW